MIWVTGEHSGDRFLLNEYYIECVEQNQADKKLTEIYMYQDKMSDGYVVRESLDSIFKLIKEAKRDNTTCSA